MSTHNVTDHQRHVPMTIFAYYIRWLLFRIPFLKRLTATAYAKSQAEWIGRSRGFDIDKYSNRLRRLLLKENKFRIHCDEIISYIDSMLNFHRKSFYYRQGLVSILDGFGERALPYLIRYFNDSDQLVASTAISAFTKIGNDRVFQVLVTSILANQPNSPTMLRYLIEHEECGLTNEQGTALFALWDSHTPTQSFVDSVSQIARASLASEKRLLIKIVRDAVIAVACELALGDAFDSKPYVLGWLGDPMRFRLLQNYHEQNLKWLSLSDDHRKRFINLFEDSREEFITIIARLDQSFYAELSEHRMFLAQVRANLAEEQRRRQSHPCPQCGGSGISAVEVVRGVTRVYERTYQCVACGGTGIG